MMKLMITLIAVLSTLGVTSSFALENTTVVENESVTDLFQIIESDFEFLSNNEKVDDLFNVVDTDFDYIKGGDTKDLFMGIDLLNLDYLNEKNSDKESTKILFEEDLMTLPKYESFVFQEERIRIEKEKELFNLAEAREKKLIDSIIDEGLDQLGKPYVYGATGVKSFDCSMLVKHSMESEGVSFPRTSREQRDFTKYISFNELERGDLIFWHKGSIDDAQNVCHVAIYLGDGKMLHATPPKVKVSNVVKNKQGKYNISYGRYDYSKNFKNL